MTSYLKKMTGPGNPAWRGGVTYKRPHGNYVGAKHVKCPVEFLAMRGNNGYVPEHRLVVARILGRCLTRREVVHHIDFDPRNNHPSNLMLFACQRDHKLFEHHGSPAPIWSGSNLFTTEVSFGACE